MFLMKGAAPVWMLLAPVCQIHVGYKNKFLFHFTFLNGLARTPCGANLLANHAVFVLGRVEDDGLKSREVNVALLVKDALVGTHVDNLAHHTGTTVLVLIECYYLALQRQFVLVDDRCIDIGTWSDRKAGLLHLVGHVIAGDDAEVVALHDVVLRGEADITSGFLFSSHVAIMMAGSGVIDEKSTRNCGLPL